MFVILQVGADPGYSAVQGQRHGQVPEDVLRLLIQFLLLLLPLLLQSLLHNLPHRQPIDIVDPYVGKSEHGSLQG